MESIAYKYRDLGIKFIKISEEIPEFNICVSKDTDTALQSELKNAFISLDLDSSEGAAILRSLNESYTGFVEASDEEYDGIKNMMIRLELI